MSNLKAKIAQIFDASKRHPASFVLGILAMVLVGNIAYFSVAGKFGANVDHSTTSIHGGHTLVTAGDSLGGFMSGADKTKLDNLGLTMKGTLKALVTTNVTQSGLASTLDGVAINTDGMAVGTFEQTTTTQDGCWQAHSGAWTRCPELATGSTATDGYYVVVGGTTNKGVWALSGGVTGTNDLTATNLVSGGGAVSSVNAQTGAVVLTAANVRAFAAIDATAATTAALPSYTYANGTAGVGATITASANGALPAQDGVTLSANDVLFVEHGAAATDNGPYDVTSAGSGGSAFVLTRHTGLDQAAEVPGSVVHVLRGQQRGGGVYTYRAVAAVTMGTTALWWPRTDSKATSNEVLCYTDEADEIQAQPTTGTNAWAGGFMQRFSSGTSAALSVDSTNTGVLIGDLSGVTGSTTTAMVGMSDAWTAANTAPGGGRSFTFSTATQTLEFEARIAVPVLSNGTDTFAINAGFMKQKAASQKLPADGCVISYDTTSGVNTTNWLFSCTNAGTGTPVDSGVTINAGTYNRIWETFDAGSTGPRFGIDSSTTLATVTTNLPNGTVLGTAVHVAKVAGTSSVNAIKIDWIRRCVYFHQGRVP